MLQIYCKNNNIYREFPIGSSLSDIYYGFNLNFPYPVVSAKVNNRSEGLNYRVYNNKDVEFLDVRDSSGMRTYVRSLCFVLFKAVTELFPDSKLFVEHPISKGYFCNLRIGRPLTLEDVAAIKQRMLEIVAEDIPYHRTECHTTEAVRIFSERGMNDKVKLLETSGSLYTYYYTLADTVDYYYGNLLPSTGFLKLFDIVKYYDGLLLRIPSRENPEVLEEAVKQEKMLDVFKEYLNWSYIMGINNVGDFNLACQDGQATDLINVAEALQEKKIAQIADTIFHRGENGDRVKLVLISGPSSSGKTTFSKRLLIQLMTNGLRPYPISLDNYFVDRSETPRDENGDYDYESLYALDLELFNEHLQALLRGEEVEIPRYNFMLGKKEYKGDKLKISEQTILILEGIHALNPELTPQIPSHQKFKIYVSALTTISLDDHNWIPTTDNRLLRRIIRDFNYRDYSAQETISRWPSVRAGEDKWIFPYQENADVMFNSALLFEFAVLRSHAEPILTSVPRNCPEYAEADRLLKFIKYFIPIQGKEIPPTSLLREFLGGSSFIY
ncbi:nucleoside kinase [Bacteroides sp.]|uniref:nucleoside kinase n=1 Tax=Bacteroides sp. TaxID=29523 RepID=UPI001B6EF70C|nr:nucleoside kinase [Bacteroides sp.]MBP6065649.1 nucleoside kinase [Bacteroides sp.]MBP6067752.1 nucleoside kinase [Bacteroides sp.]MBP6936739.1 nucleoside kinase [Bacteroides sp.]MBP8622200.1 nucleoside kinase [Bacteroides sp.]MBP9506615.1 nucleoside kinase [Bacteroides sp.]